ncbi:hypothetical protein, partial [Carbonactinospora thermoautotrophica]
GDVPVGPLARRLDDLTHVEAGGGGPNLMAMLSGGGGGAARRGRRPKGDLPPHVIDHILKGEIKNGRVVGYHYRPGGRDAPNRKTVEKEWVDQREVGFPRFGGHVIFMPRAVAHDSGARPPRG